ncbi:uncharacterized protein LOC105025280 [Esox lucius]|uniref:uncharacterized protein LOC105025280 n=1 Tax=Esox lucius TaxID=8010 RepID=UPI001476903F|nr:uncharacterized protein LOC105025280 [Esox lucius]
MDYDASAISLAVCINHAHCHRNNNFLANVTLNRIKYHERNSIQSSVSNMDHNDKRIRRALRRRPYSSACVKTHNRPPIITMYDQDQASGVRVSLLNQRISAIIPETPCQSGRMTCGMGTSHKERCSSARSNDSLKTFKICERESNDEVYKSRSASENVVDEHRIRAVLDQNDNLSICSVNESDFLSDDEDYDSWAASENLMDEHGLGAVPNQNDNMSIRSFNESDFLSDDDYNVSDENGSDTPGESDRMNSASLKLPTLIWVAAHQPNSALLASVSTLKEVSLQTDVVPAGQPLEEHLDKEQHWADTQEDSLTRVKEDLVSMEHIPDEGLKICSGGGDFKQYQGDRQKKLGGCFRWIGEWLSRSKGEEMRDRGRMEQKPGTLIMDIPCPLTPPSHTLASWLTVEYIPHPNRARLAPITNVSEKGKKLLLEIARDSQQPDEKKQTVKEAKKHRKRKEKAIARQQEKSVGPKEKQHMKKDKISLRKRFLQWLLSKMCCMRK